MGLSITNKRFIWLSYILMEDKNVLDFKKKSPDYRVNNELEWFRSTTEFGPFAFASSIY